MSELFSYLTTHEDQFRRNRLAALYSDFRHLREINPDGYVANIEAWRKGLVSAAKGGHMPGHGNSPDHFVLSVDDELLRALECKEWGRPLALGAVVHDSVMKKEVVPLREFMAVKESIYREHWATIPWTIASWGFKQLGLTRGQHDDRILSAEKLVIVSNLEEACKEIVQRVAQQTSRIEKVYSKRLFSQDFANVLGSKHPMSQADIDVLLKFMARDMRVISYDDQTIKFKGYLEAKPSVITSEDATVASLRTLKIDIQVQINALTQRIQILSASARDAVAQKSRQSAVVALRSKKIAEVNLSRQVAVLAQLEDIYSKISQAANQVELVRIMKGSTEVLKALNTEMGGIECVENVVDQLKEQMAQVSEAQDVIAEVGQIDNGDLVDDELEAIEREEREKKEAAEHLEREKEQEGIAEVKRKLSGLGAAERKATDNREGSGTKLTENSRLPDKLVGETTDAFKQISFEESLT